MTVRYLLETHAAVWLLEGNDKLSVEARTAIEAEETVAIADITLLEIALLAERGTIQLKPDLGSGLSVFAEKLTVLPLDARLRPTPSASNCRTAPPSIASSRQPRECTD